MSVRKFYIMQSAVESLLGDQPTYTVLTNQNIYSHPVRLVMADDYAAIEAERDQLRAEVEALRKDAAQSAAAPAHPAERQEQEGLHVWRATTRFGETCHFGEASTARAWAGENGTVDRVELTPVPELRVVGRQDQEEVQMMREALTRLLSYAERQVCTHEETHRGGTIWEICDMCGAKWADDEGGKTDFEWPAEIEAARAALATSTGQEVE